VGSKFTWNASAILGYSISRVVSLGLGIGPCMWTARAEAVPTNSSTR